MARKVRVRLLRRVLFCSAGRGEYGGGRMFTGHGVVRVLVNNLCATHAGNLRPE